MTLTLHNLKIAKGATKKRKRIGRGNAAGQGTYCGRGIKGQKARAGVSGLKRLGLKQTILATPKKKGFNRQPKMPTVNINFTQINKFFKDNDQIDSAALIKVGIIKISKNKHFLVKILNTGELKLKNLNFTNISASSSAKAKIESLDGKLQ